jgi:hypothetical protein
MTDGALLLAPRHPRRHPEEMLLGHPSVQQTHQNRDGVTRRPGEVLALITPFLDAG